MSVDVFVLLQVQVAGLSGVDAPTMLMQVLVGAGVSRTLTDWDRQYAALFHTPNIHSNVMLYLVGSSDHPVTLLFAFLPLRNSCKCL